MIGSGSSARIAISAELTGSCVRSQSILPMRSSTAGVALGKGTPANVTLAYKYQSLDLSKVNVAVLPVDAE